MEDKNKGEKEVFLLKKETNKEEEKTKACHRAESFLRVKNKKKWTRKREKRGEQFFKDKRFETKVIIFSFRKTERRSKQWCFFFFEKKKGHSRDEKMYRKTM